VAGRPFDPELYLRRAGELAVLDSLDDHQVREDAELVQTAASLVTVGALSEERAQEIVDEYTLALSLRGSGHFGLTWRRSIRPPRGAPEALDAPTVRSCRDPVDPSPGAPQVLYAAFYPDSTSVAITVEQTASRGTRHSPPASLGGLGNALTITDDQGTSRPALFAGHGNGSRFTGQLRTQGPLSASTAWIELDGDRTELADTVEPPPVAIEKLAERSPAVDYLWGCLSVGRHGFPVPTYGSHVLDAAIRTMVDAGALDPEAPELDRLRAVERAMAGEGEWDALPEPWASLMTGRSRHDGPSGIVPFGIVTSVDGTHISIEALRFHEGTMETHVVVSPDITHLWGPFSMQVRQSPIRWWAEDDRGNAYLGGPGSWGGGGTRGEGTIRYWPSLYPDATMLHLMPTGNRERAVITVELPTWSERR